MPKTWGPVKLYGHDTALDGVDIGLFPGEALAVIGDDGAGTSSLINALPGALRRTTGAHDVSGADGGTVVADREAARAAGLD